jgi:hypothetical protein
VSEQGCVGRQPNGVLLAVTATGDRVGSACRIAGSDSWVVYHRPWIGYSVVDGEDAARAELDGLLTGTLADDQTGH